MATSNREIMAQYIFLAQLEAQKSACKCKVCLLLRKGCDAAVAQALEASKATTPVPGAEEIMLAGAEQGEQSI